MGQFHVVVHDAHQKKHMVELAFDEGTRQYELLRGWWCELGAIGVSKGTDFFVAMEKGVLWKEGGGGRPDGSVVRSVNGRGSAVVFGEGDYFCLGEDGLL